MISHVLKLYVLYVPLHCDRMFCESQDVPSLPPARAHTLAGVCRNTEDSAWIGAGLTGVRAELTKSVGTEDRRMRHFEGVEQVCLQDMFERRKGADIDKQGDR